MLAAEGLTPSARGKRVRFEGKTKKTVIDGPFAEAKELVAGFWIRQVKSIEEAVEWVRRIPNTDAKDGESRRSRSAPSPRWRTSPACPTTSRSRKRACARKPKKNEPPSPTRDPRGPNAEARDLTEDRR
jgi:hypothetical protein